MKKVKITEIVHKYREGIISYIDAGVQLMELGVRFARIEHLLPY